MEDDPQGVNVLEDHTRHSPDRLEAKSEQRRVSQSGTDQKRVSGVHGFTARARRHPHLSAVVGLIALVAIALGTIWWLSASRYETTDDAFIDSRTASISSQVNGAIIDLPVRDYQPVNAGDVLARIDDRDYRAAVGQAIAQVAQAKASIANLDAQMDAQQARIDQAQKQVVQAQAALTFARQENTRAQGLLQRGAGTQESAQQTASQLQQNEAAYDADQANLIVTQRQIDVLKTQRQVSTGQLEQAQASLEQAQANLARTEIKAPVTGSIANLNTAKGDYAQIGQALMMLVPRNVWVTANFKETQLARIRPGQPVDIYVDAYPKLVLHGHVDSIQAGSGAAFSLLPPENATGNFVKVIQRVPVKILFDQRPDFVLGPGMSVEPYVKVQ